MAVKEYPHYFLTWEVYPRVHYFQRRYTDLHTRFTKLMKAIPERFYTQFIIDELKDLDSYLRNLLQVTVIGKEDMNPGDLIISDEALEKHTVLPNPPHTNTMHICICYVKVENLNEAGLQDICTAIEYVSKDFLERCQGLHSVMIVCETKIEISKEDAEIFRSKLQQAVEKVDDLIRYVADILVGPKGDSLRNSISNVVEKEIIDGFNKILTFLQRFMRKDIRYNHEDMNILENDTVVNEIKGFLQNGLALVDAKRLSKDISLIDLILQTLCDKIMCAAVAPLATKHNIPEWVCHGLLCELNFGQDLRESISANTLHHFEKFEKYVCDLENMVVKPETCTQIQNTCHIFDFLLYKLQKDMKGAVTSVEIKLSAMNRVTTVMRKMMFEIRGYLKQTLIPVEITDIGQRELTPKDITDKLQKDIMSTDGVYGMGILFGQLQIHLNKNMEESTVTKAKETLADIMKRLDFHHPYFVGIVDNNPIPLANNFIEQGDTISSAFPDDSKDFREGTLGCFVRSGDGSLYALTCAHVVDPHAQDEHDVYIKTHGSPRLFAKSNPRTIIYGTQLENGLHLADFAAIKVLKEVEDMCSHQLKDEIGNIKTARFANESSDELVGDHVYKYGAKTRLTEGIIASRTYKICVGKSNEHLVIIESLPEPSEELYGIFSSKGDDSVPSSQTSNLSAESSQTCTDEKDITDYLVEPGDKDSSDDDNRDNSNFSELQEFSYSPSECTTGADTCTAFSKLNTIQPRPETVTERENSDSDMDCMRNPNEILSVPLTVNGSLVPIVPFADQGDIGSIVCKRDLQTDTIIAISMVTAGDFRFKDTVTMETESDSRKCLSVRLDQSLAKLKEQCGVNLQLTC